MAFGRTVGYDMSVVISGIEKHSPAAKADIHPGDRLVSINGNEIIDVLDYRFYMMEKKLKLILDSGGREKAVVVRKKDEYDDLGLSALSIRCPLVCGKLFISKTTTRECPFSMEITSP